MRLCKPAKPTIKNVAYHDGAIDALRIVRPTGPGPIRQVITGTKVVMTTSYPSKKNRASHPAEAQTEAAANRHDEVVTAIVRAKPQPFRIEAMIAGKFHRSIPDRIRLMSDASRVLVEFKREWEDFDRDGAEVQSMLAQAAADELGLVYQKQTLASLGDATRRENIHTVQLHRFAQVSLRQETIAHRLLTKRGPLPLGELADALHTDHRVGFAAVCALMVMRIAAIDIDGGAIGRDTRVDPVPPLPISMPSINV